MVSNRSRSFEAYPAVFADAGRNTAFSMTMPQTANVYAAAVWIDHCIRTNLV